VLRCLTADTQCSAVSPTARPAVAHTCVSRQQGRLLLLSAGQRLPSVVVHCTGSILNAAARLVFSVRRLERITPLLRELHWLQVPERITFRICVLTHRCFNGSAPAYLAENIHLTADVESRLHLRSSTTTTLVVPPVQRPTLGDRASNSLPSSLRTVSSLVPFRHQLKTFLFVHSSDIH